MVVALGWGGLFYLGWAGLDLVGWSVGWFVTVARWDGGKDSECGGGGWNCAVSISPCFPFIFCLIGFFSICRFPLRIPHKNASFCVFSQPKIYRPHLPPQF